MVPIEVKSAAINNHKSIDNFEIKYSKQVGERFLLSQKDVGKIGTLKLKPIYDFVLAKGIAIIVTKRN